MLTEVEKYWIVPAANEVSHRCKNGSDIIAEKPRMAPNRSKPRRTHQPCRNRLSRRRASAAGGCYNPAMPKIKELECSRCKSTVSAEKPQTLCPSCAGSLYVRYDMSAAQGLAKREQIASDGQ